MPNIKIKRYKSYLSKLPLKLFYFSTLLTLILFSCSIEHQELKKQKKIDKKDKKDKKRSERREKQKLRKLDNDFLAYYNTFYLSKIKFKNALESDSSSSTLYYNEATKWADTVIYNFTNTDYIFDAYYIKARSSYAKNIISPANYYFGEIIKNKENPYYYDALVYLGNINLRLQDRDRLNEILKELDLNIENFNKNISSLHKKIPYKFIRDELLNTPSNYYLLKAQSSIYLEKENSEIEEYFSSSISLSNDCSQKIKIYNHSLNYYKKANNHSKRLEHLNNLIQEIPCDQSAFDLIQEWVHHARKIGENTQILSFVNEKLDKELLPNEELFYLIERAKTYYALGMKLEAINEYSRMIEKYESNVHKNYLSDVYYELGKIYLKDYFNFEEALNYFDLSYEKNTNNIDAKNYSNYINYYLEKLDNFQIQISQDSTAINQQDSTDSLDNNLFYIPLPEDYRFTSNNNIDTLLFNMASVLHFGLELDSIALESLQIIYHDHIDSPLIPIVLKFLNRIQPDDKWELNFLGTLQTFLNYEDIQLDTKINNRRKVAFEKMNESLYEAIDLFDKIYTDFNDDFSLYMIAYIYDNYLNDIANSVKYYKKYIENEDVEKYIQVKSRLDNIENLLSDELKIVNQKISYLNTINYINADSLNFDNLLIDLEECKIGPNTIYKDKCDNLIQVIQFPLPEIISDSLSKNLVDKWINGMKMDERLFTLANIIKKETSNKDLAKEYYELIIDFYNDSEYINEVYFSLQHLDYNKNWKDSLLLYIKEKNDLIEEYEPRTGGDVINAVNNRLKPLDLSSKNRIYEIYFDSLYSILDLDNFEPLNEYDFKFKQNIIVDRKNSKNNYLISKVSDYEDYSMHFSISENKVLQWEPDFEIARELFPESYLITPDISFITSTFDEVKMIDRYNMKNTEANCEYLDKEYNCYEIEVISSENDYYRTLWILKLDKNDFLIIKEQDFDINGNILNQRNIEYKKIDPYYLVSKIIDTDFENNLKRIQKIDNVSINDGLSPDLFILNKKNKLNKSIPSLDKLYLENQRLDSIYSLLFYIPEPSDSLSVNDTINLVTMEDDKLFQYNQSINQYFYFVEDASIDGVELTNNDWLVAYNNDIIVGARKYTEGGMIDIPIMGYDNSSKNTEIATNGYCQIGDIPSIKVFRNNGEFIQMDVILVDGKLEFQSIGNAMVILKRD